MAVYSVDKEKVKNVKLKPKEDWGGKGLLGADISFGFLNKLPLRKIDKQNIRKQ